MECEVTGQQGTVVKVNDKIHVWVISGEDCSSCSAKGVCPASKGRVLEFPKPQGYDLKPGDKVLLEIEENKGPQALFIMYVIPFFLLMAVMIAVRIITGNDGLAGLAALGSLVPYYFVIYLLRRYFEKKFQFKIKPL